MLQQQLLRVLVVGGGAIGSLVAARLALGGAHVTVVRRGAAVAQGAAAAAAAAAGVPLASGFARLVLDGTTLAAPVRVAAGLSALPAPSAFDVVVVAVKARDTAEVARQLRECAARHALGPGAAVVSLQNGAGNVELLSAELKQPAFSVVPALTYMGVGSPQPLVAQVFGRGRTLVGSPATPAALAAVHALATAYNRGATTPAEQLSVSSEVQPMVWTKLLANSVINPLTALLGRENGCVTDVRLLPLVRRAAREFEMVAAKEGVRLQLPEGLDATAFVLSVATGTATNTSSMLADVRAGRHTEVDAINGFVAQRARAHGLNVPVIESLAHLVRALNPQE
jgi:2-dehydropantoate 2-reductase